MILQVGLYRATLFFIVTIIIFELDQININKCQIFFKSRFAFYSLYGIILSLTYWFQQFSYCSKHTQPKIHLNVDPLTNTTHNNLSILSIRSIFSSPSALVLSYLSSLAHSQFIFHKRREERPSKWSK